ncbi:isoprenylcysteine carboxylmethyltransferase family protein, partial [Candidatus Saccharibacteria bacterium]|nr:isoprenylcysteine carboxylmethyltransferase family protein [Candidatus Saccharibacteria bacterium]
MLKNTLSAKHKALVFVIIQAILLLGLIFISNYLGPNIYRFKYIGTVLEFIGLLGIIVSAITIRSSLTVMPLPKDNGQLGTTGLYKYVRHPMYTCVLLLSLGIALASGSIIKYGIVIGLYLLFYYKSK